MAVGWLAGLTGTWRARASGQLWPVDMQCPGAVCVPVADCLACYLLVLGFGCGEDGPEVGTVGGRQRPEVMLADVDLDVLSVVAFGLGEQDEDLAEVGR